MNRFACFWILFQTLFIRLKGELFIKDVDPASVNYTTLWELLQLQANPYLQDLQGHWSFNDTIDISKYEQFDHTRFQGSRELSMEELLEKLRELEKAGRRHPQAARSTQPPDEMPVFDTSLVTNVTAQLGTVAFMHCRVKNLNSRAVSWIRKRDWHILSSATLTYTNDERFQVVHNEGSDDWALQIKYVQQRDSGAYECQVATDRGSLSHHFNLQVLAPSAHILGTGEIHVGQGSPIAIVCVIEDSPIPPQFVMWYHNDHMINYEEGGRDPVSVVTEPGGERTHSKLLIARASSRHSGNYSCRASNTQPGSVYVFVSTDGDNIAAIQRQSAPGSSRPCFLLLLMLVFRSLLS